MLKAIDCTIKQFLMNRSVDLKSILKWNHRKECIEYSDEDTETTSVPLNLYHDDLIVSEDSQTIMVTDADVKEPSCVRDALEKQEWLDAMQTEIDSLHSNGVWKLVELPEGRKCVGVKTNAGGSTEV